jgi:hypothetical protein
MNSREKKEILNLCEDETRPDSGGENVTYEEDEEEGPSGLQAKKRVQQEPDSKLVCKLSVCKISDKVSCRILAIHLAITFSDKESLNFLGIRESWWLERRFDVDRLSLILFFYCFPLD